MLFQTPLIFVKELDKLLIDLLLDYHIALYFYFLPPYLGVVGILGISLCILLARNFVLKVAKILILFDLESPVEDDSKLIFITCSQELNNLRASCGALFPARVTISF